MVLNLRRIWQYETPYNIIVRNHRCNIMTFSPPGGAKYIQFDKPLDKSANCTEINVTDNYGRTACVQLEECNCYLIVTGNIKDGRKVVKVTGMRTLDIVFGKDGHMRFNYWNDEESNQRGSFSIYLIPFSLTVDDDQ